MHNHSMHITPTMAPISESSRQPIFSFLTSSMHELISEVGGQFAKVPYTHYPAPMLHASMNATYLISI